MTRTFTGLAYYHLRRKGLSRRAISAKPIFLRDTIESEPAGRETDSFKRTRPACVFPSFSSIAGEAWIHSFGRFPSVDYGIHRRGQKRLDLGAGVVFLRHVDRSLRETLGGLISRGSRGERWKKCYECRTDQRRNPEAELG
jgi:hypothetical protein